MVDYEHIVSRGAHGHHAVGRYDALIGSQREIWIGSDGSGLIGESSGPVSFFTTAGRARWEAAGSPELAHAAGIELFAPGCLSASRAWRAELPVDPNQLESALRARSSLSLRGLQQLLSEAVVEPALCRALHEVARRLPGVQVLDGVADQIGRVGRGLARTERVHRVELVFRDDLGELLAYQHVLADSQPFAPAGTLHSWAAFLHREVVDRLPPGTPPVPKLPCEPPGAGRAFVIDPRFHVTTGYVDDPLPQLAELKAQGVITRSEYERAKADVTKR